MLTVEQYAIERAICDKAREYAERIMCEGGAKRKRNYITAKEAAHPDYAVCDNAMRGRVEEFEFVMTPAESSARYLAYLKLENGRALITSWTGIVLGEGRVNSVHKRRGIFSSEYVYGRAKMRNGREYAFQGAGHGMCCSLKLLKKKGD